MLKPIPGQPIDFDPHVEREGGCERVPFCVKYKKGDTVMAQIRQEPCSDNLICNPTFAEVEGELLTNGDFSSGSDGWNVVAGSWTFSGSLSIVNDVGIVSQDVTLIPGTSYTITFVILSITGTVGIMGSDFSTPGVKTVTFTATPATTAISFVTGLGAISVEIDDVSLTQTQTGCWNAIDGWIIGDGFARAFPIGVAGAIQQDVLSGESPGEFYQIQFTVREMISGAITCALGGYNFAIVTTNGKYTFYTFTPKTDDYLSFINNGSVECILTDVSFKRMSKTTDLTCYVLDENGVYYNSPNISFAETSPGVYTEFINLSVNTSSFDEGCYTIGIGSSCGGGQVEFNDQLFLNSDFADGTAWGGLSVDNGSATLAGGVCSFDVQQIQKQDFYISQTVVMPEDGFFNSTLDMNIITSGTVLVWLIINGTSYQYSTGTYSSLTTGNHALPAGTYNAQIHVQVLNGSIEDTVEIDGSTLDITYYHWDLASQCFQVIDNYNGRVIEGKSDKPYALGFLFNSSFWIWLRHTVDFIKPKHPKDPQVNLNSLGVKRKYYGQIGKTYDMVVGFADESLHEAVATALECDHFTVDSQEYVCEEKTYAMDEADNSTGLAEAVVEVSRVDSVRFNVIN